MCPAWSGDSWSSGREEDGGDGEQDDLRQSRQDDPVSLLDAWMLA